VVLGGLVRKAAFSFSDGELRVDAPLATYRLRRRPDVKAEELKGHRNRAVRAETARAVDAWLRNYRVSV